MAGNVVELTRDNFEQEVLKSAVPVVVDFWATWCVPCKMIAPVVEQISGEYAGKCKVGKLNIDDAMDIAAKFSVMNIPTVIFFKDGAEFTRVVGVVSKDGLANKLEEVLA
jgi:thioredoxin 1